MADVGPVAPSVADASFVVSLHERVGPAGAVRERIHMGGHAHNTERGASGVEYVGMIVVAAIVVAAIVLAISPAGADVRAATCRAVGQVLQTELGCSGGGAGDEAGPPRDVDYQPGPCTVTQSGSQISSVVSVGIIDFGENAGLARQTMSDGSVSLTATDGSQLGVSSGAGAELRTGGGLELGASIDFGGGYSFAAGDTWTFPDAESADEFQELLQEHRTREHHRGPSRTGLNIADAIDPLDPLPPPDSVSRDMGVTADVSGQVGFQATGNADGSGPNVQLNAIAGSVDPEAHWIQTTSTNGTETTEDDSRTYTVDMSITPELGSDIWAEDFGLGDTHGMSLAITEDARGRVTDIAIVTTNEGAVVDGNSVDVGGKEGIDDDSNSGSGSVFASSESTTATVTETKLTLDPDAPGYQEDMAVVEGWLGGDGSGYEWAGVMPMGAVNPAQRGSDPFSQLMHERATVSAITREGVTDTKGLAAEVKFGVKLGFDFSSSSSDSEAVYAGYLGAPSGGTREMVRDTNCLP